MTTAVGSLEGRIKAVLDERAMLKHPFYRAWSEGTLDRARLRAYARQYYHFELAFPRFLSAIHTRTDSRPIRQMLLENMWDEEHGDRNHPALWLQFAAALRLSAADVRGAKLQPQTRTLIDHYAGVAQSAPIAEALATLFAFEGQVPALAWQTIKALSDHYAFEPGQFEFFSVHLVSDVAHAGAEMDAIQQTCTGEEGVIAATERACDRLLAFLDGCLGKGDTF